MMTRRRQAIAALLWLLTASLALSQERKSVPVHKPGEADALTEEIRPRLLAIWEHYKNQEADAHNALLADDYQAVSPDGTLHNRKPTAQEIAQAPLTRYVLSQVRAVPLGPDAALVTFFAEVDGPSGGKIIHVKYTVGNVWVRRGGKWMCRYYQGTQVQ